MAVRLEKTLKRELFLKGQTYVVTVSPEGLKLTVKGRRNGLELAWDDLVTGEAALATALNASLGQLHVPPKPKGQKTAAVTAAVVPPPKSRRPRR
jgi:hypothetical protein